MYKLEVTAFHANEVAYFFSTKSQSCLDNEVLQG
jgi:hypothetical protein